MELTPQEIEVAIRAAKRYGLVAPTFVEVIDELTPEYANFNGSTVNEPCTNRAIVRRWHRVAAYAMTLVDVQTSGRKPQHKHSKKKLPECARHDCTKRVKEARSKYCSQECSQLARTDRLIERTCKRCGNTYERSINQSKGKLTHYCHDCATAADSAQYHTWEHAQR